MAKDTSDIIALLLRHHRTGLSASEQRELDQWVAASEENALLYKDLTDDEKVQAQLRHIDSYAVDPVRERILAQVPDAFLPSAGTQSRGTGTLRRIRMNRAAAAAVIILLGGGLWWVLSTRTRQAPAALSTVDIPAPSRTRATLTLAGGGQVDLDSAASGALATQGNVNITKDPDGQVTYRVDRLQGGDPAGELLYNTLTNPRGSPTVNLTLSDGTKVWLNAESSIRYPAILTGADRTVEITGEAYFEAAKDHRRPFRVQKGNTRIEVLGTSFNVNTYADEPAIKVTLVDGKVRVEDGVHQLTLRPGEQAIVTDSIRLAGNLDMETTLAWKNGRFAFMHADLSAVLRQLARWYNVQVSYEGTIPERYFTGAIGQSLTLDQVLKGLTRARVHYRIESNNKLIILP